MPSPLFTLPLRPTHRKQSPLSSTAILLPLLLSLLAFPVAWAVPIPSSVALLRHNTVLSSNSDPVPSSHPRHHRGSLSQQGHPLLHSANMTYDLQFSPHCVTIDSLTEHIESISCEPTTVTLTFNSTDAWDESHHHQRQHSTVPVMTICSVEEALMRWDNRTLLNGGMGWGCVDGITGQPTLLMRRVLSMTALNTSTLLITTTSASVLDCFDTLHMKVQLNHTKANLLPSAPVIVDTANITDADEGVALSETVYPLVRSRGATDANASSAVGRFHTMSPTFTWWRSSPAPGVNVFSDGQSVSFGWSEANWDYPTATINFNLVFSGSNIRTWTASISALSATFTLPSGLGTSLGYTWYIELDWSAAGSCFHLHCCTGCTADDTVFTIALGNAGKVSAPSSVFSWSCERCQSGGSTVVPPSWACELCDTAYQSDLSVEATCTDCYVDYQYSTYDLSLSFGEAFQVSLDFTGSGLINVDFLLDLQMEFSTGAQTLLIPPPLTLASLSGSFAGFSFPFVLGLEVQLTYEAAVNASLLATGGFDGTVSFGGTVSYNTDSGWGQLPSGSIAHNSHGLTVSTAATLDCQIGLLTNLSLSLLSVFSASVGVEVYMDVVVYFTYPPFPALSYPYQFNLDPSQPALLHSGDCTVAHFLETQLSVGVRNNALYVGIDINILSWDIFREYQNNNVFGLTTFLPLVGGCGLSTSSFTGGGFNGGGAATFTMLFPLSIQVDVPSVRNGLLFDLANALSASVTRFVIADVIIGTLGSSRRLLQQQGYIVYVAVLPPTDNSPTAAALVEAAKAQQQDPGSALRSSPTARSMEVLPPSTDSGSSSGGSSGSTSWTDGGGTTIDDSSSGGGLSIGIIVAIAVVVGVVLMVAIAVGVVFYLRHRAKATGSYESKGGQKQGMELTSKWNRGGAAVTPVQVRPRVAYQ